MGHVLGYSVANDVTMRDFQYKTHQWLQGKAWDAATPVGPVIVGRDEVDISTAGIRTFVNGQKVQCGAAPHVSPATEAQIMATRNRSNALAQHLPHNRASA